MTEGAKRKVESVQVRLEKSVLYPMLRGRDVDRWKAEPSAHLLFVQDVSARRGIPVAKFKTECPLAFKWLESHRKLLVERAAYKRYFKPEKDAFYTMFNVGDYTIMPWKVMWPEVANELEASVCGPQGRKPSLADHTIVEVGLSTETEAHYVSGVLNSTLFRFGVNRYIVLHPDPHILDSFRIPKFNATSMLHQQIAAEAQRLSGGAADAGEPVHEQLDKLCAQLWGVTELELASVETAYRELYVSAPKESSEGEPASEE
jgi:hypothetical protein